MIRKIAYLAFACFITGAALAAPPVLNPGRWEVTIKNLLADGAPTSTTQICITKEMADHPAPVDSSPNDDCQVTSTMAGNHLKFMVKCGRNKTTTNAELTY